jgi:hypothetical protein
MPTEQALVALPCTLSPGIVSGERVFEVILANGQTYTGVAPRHFCWNAQGRLVGEIQPVRSVTSIRSKRPRSGTSRRS